MSYLKKSFVSIATLLTCTASAHDSDTLKGIYNGLDPSSISEHLALYKLYPTDEVGKQALKDVQDLLTKAHSNPEGLVNLPVTNLSMEGFISFMLGKKIKADLLEEEHLAAIEQLASHLKNRKLKGYQIQSEEDLLKLESKDIDLARALLVAQQAGQEPDWLWIRNYEAQLDFMALQVLARLPSEPTSQDVIRELNRLIFFEMRYRFPALTSLKKGDEPFSKLTTVLDSKNGVCLGISILYLCLAQRLDLPLEIVIPPGHIFVRHVDQDNIINIETTARGINYPSENYLDINTKSLKQATLKEVIGFVFYNISSSYLINSKNYPVAIENYLHCLQYAPGHEQATELLGYAYALNGQDKEAKACFKKLQNYQPEDQIASVYLDMSQDYLKNKIGMDALAAILEPVEEDCLDQITKKQNELQKIVKKYPHFKAGLFFLAETHEQLSQTKPAIQILEKLHKLDSGYPYVEFTLANLYLSELDLPKAWEHTRHLESLLKKHEHKPKIFRELKKALSHYSLEP